MANPDPEEFARTVLWNLASLRAEIAMLRMDVLELKHAGDAKEIEQILEWRRKNRNIREKLFSDDLQTCRLEDRPPPTQTDLSR